jgi:sn-glycerol 3-phosphate transport system substrate-binding protein
MKRRTLLAGAAAAPVAAAPVVRAMAAGPVQITWWHAMSGALGDQVARITKQFNEANKDVVLTSVFKGSYPDTLNASIAAWRAGKAPNVTQVFDVGTGTMLAAGPAVKQIWQLAKETGADIKPETYIPAVRGYYSLPDGRLASMPFNSSTAVMWYNKDAFKAAGLDAANPPKTWADVMAAAKVLKAKWADPENAKGGPTRYALTTSWLTWIQFEEFSAIHNIAFASEADGFNGLGAVLECNSPAHVAQLQRFMDMGKEGTFKYGGRDSAPDPMFYTGVAAIGFGSSAGRGDIVRNAKFDYGEALMPWDPSVSKEPHNTFIGGASLWAMTAPGRTEAEYKAVAAFLKFLALPEQDAMWAQNSGYVPVTLAGDELSKKQGYYEKNPGTDVPIQSLLRSPVTQYSRGMRLGRLPEIRNILYEECEQAFAGKKTAKAALDETVSRGNVVLRAFQKSVGG